MTPLPFLRYIVWGGGEDAVELWQACTPKEKAVYLVAESFMWFFLVLAAFCFTMAIIVA